METKFVAVQAADVEENKYGLYIFDPEQEGQGVVRYINIGHFSDTVKLAQEHGRNVMIQYTTGTERCDADAVWVLPTIVNVEPGKKKVIPLSHEEYPAISQ